MPTGRRLKVIAIDGPAGAGKSTVAKKVASKLGLRYLDTGAMYRCVALMVERRGAASENVSVAAEEAAKVLIDFSPGDPQRVLCNGEDVTEAIRRPHMGDFASAVSAYPQVRSQMVRRQQAIVGEGGIVLEGRDATTVIAPHADVKIYLTASIDERAKRRCRELESKGLDVDLGEIRKAIAERDHNDSTRADSPLRVAEGAVVVDTDGLTVEQVVDRIAELAET